MRMRPPIGSAVRSGLSKRCPHCRMGKLFAGWFRMRRECAVCGLSYFRESGYYIGAMILNYGFTTALVVAVYVVSLFFPDLPGVSVNFRLALWMLFAIGISLLLMRLSYSLWLSLDYWIEPWNPKE